MRLTNIVKFMSKFYLLSQQGAGVLRKEGTSGNLGNWHVLDDDKTIVDPIKQLKVIY